MRLRTITWRHAPETADLASIDPEARPRQSDADAPMPAWLRRHHYPHLEGATMHPGGADLTGQVVRGVNRR
jgi:hypothetical protein